MDQFFQSGQFSHFPGLGLASGGKGSKIGSGKEGAGVYTKREISISEEFYRMWNFLGMDGLGPSGLVLSDKQVSGRKLLGKRAQEGKGKVIPGWFPFLEIMKKPSGLAGRS